MDLPSPRRSGFSVFDRWFSFWHDLRASDRLLLGVLLIVFLVSALWSLFLLNRQFLIDVPVEGGTLIEGSIGSPRFINPVLAITRADHDLVALTHSGLLRLTPEGTLDNDLAESVTISDDGLVYNVILKQDRRWHDGTPVTAEDVAFTIGLIQKPELKSPLRGNWSGVSVELINRYEINFVLENPYAPFSENLTVGILPKHIWDTLSDEELPFSQHNIEPVGSGPYTVKEITRNPAGLISEYHLELSPEYSGEANIKDIFIRFYQNEEAVLGALKKGEINATASLSEQWLKDLDRSIFSFVSEPLPRVFSVFYNQNKNPALRDLSARAALETVVDRQELIDRAVEGYGTPTDAPLPPGWLSNISYNETEKTREERQADARAILENGGWQKNANGRWEKKINDIETPLIISLRSGNGPLFEKIASYLSEVWQELGVEVSIELYEQSDLVQTIIRPRDYQALLFGIDIGRSLDLYPFWHSSLREDPGLNVSLYANLTVDQLVSNIRVATSTQARDELIGRFVNEIDKEKPAAFLFTPSFEYVVRSNIETTAMERLQRPSERFSNVTKWHMNRSGVWPIFAN